MDQIVERLIKEPSQPSIEAMKLLQARKTLLDFRLANFEGSLTAFPAEPQLVAWRAGPHLAPSDQLNWMEGFDILFNRILVVPRSAALG
jgi:hypothetical protein